MSDSSGKPYVLESWNPDDPYGNHLPLLAVVFVLRTIDTVLEFGMGFYSTPFFLKQCRQVVSIEQQDKSWYERMRVVVKTQEWDPHFQSSLTETNTYLSSHLPNAFDLVFIDGIHREQILFATSNLARHVVVHDSQDYLNTGIWQLLGSRLEGRSLFVNAMNPATSILTSDRALAEALGKFLKGTVIAF